MSDPETSANESPPRRPEKPPWYKRRAFTWTWQIALFVVVLGAVSEWQARGLLSRRADAPAFTLTSLGGEEHSLADARGKTVVLYFFAPWCRVCAYSSANVRALHEAGRDDLEVLAIGLGYDRREDVERFAREHDLTMPVLLGNDRVLRDYRISAFPTIYVIDERGKIRDRVMGYTTEVGLRLRSL